MIGRLIPVIGFPWVMRTCAFIFLGLLIVASFTLESRNKPNPRPVVLKEFLSPLRERPFLYTTLGSFFFFWGVFVPFNFIILEGEHFGMTPELAGYLVAILNGTR